MRRRLSYTQRRRISRFLLEMSKTVNPPDTVDTVDTVALLLFLTLSSQSHGISSLFTPYLFKMTGVSNNNNNL